MGTMLTYLEPVALALKLPKHHGSSLVNGVTALGGYQEA